MTSTTSVPQLPGFNTPLNSVPEVSRHHLSMRMHLLMELRNEEAMDGCMGGLDFQMHWTLLMATLSMADFESSTGWRLTRTCSQLDVKREIVMMQVMNSITDKPDWDKKVCYFASYNDYSTNARQVFDEEITSKWREEIAQSGEDVSPKMMDWIIKELQWKSESFKETGRVTVFDVGVTKSDTAISAELQQALKEAVVPFEDVPEDQKDYHPGSNQQVIDLVHPSLCPVIFGRSRILVDRTIDLETCLGSVGQGELLPVPSEDDVLLSRRPYGYDSRSTPNSYSEKFQWLPCDVEFTEDDGCRIVSYINNAHPVKHRQLYEVVDKIITQAVPLWNQTLVYRPHNERRIHYSSVDYEDNSASEPEQESDEDDEVYQERYDAFQSSQRIIQPEPGKFQPPKLENWDLIDLRKEFSKEGLQVIVKLANIELTPQKPEYAGGSWHIEGQLVSCSAR